MNAEIFDNARACAYKLWVLTGHDSAAELWSMAEDYAYTLEEQGITESGRIEEIAAMGAGSPVYVHFIRNLAYRLSTCSGRHDAVSNWYAAERLTADSEWRESAAALASAFKRAKGGAELLTPIRNDRVRVSLLRV
ncbi:MAG: hypothetical protein LBK41_05650 [Clostridiales bacterium]|nr:hypothetical protein [Clostridiales bacterium]